MSTIWIWSFGDVFVQWPYWHWVVFAAVLEDTCKISKLHTCKVRENTFVLITAAFKVLAVEYLWGAALWAPFLCI